jgi:hypothetical protein
MNGHKNFTCIHLYLSLVFINISTRLINTKYYTTTIINWKYDADFLAKRQMIDPDLLRQE